MGWVGGSRKQSVIGSPAFTARPLAAAKPSRKQRVIGFPPLLLDPEAPGRGFGASGSSSKGGNPITRCFREGGVGRGSGASGSSSKGRNLFSCKPPSRASSSSKKRGCYRVRSAEAMGERYEFRPFPQNAVSGVSFCAHYT